MINFFNRFRRKGEAEETGDGGEEHPDPFRFDPHNVQRENPYRGLRRILVYASGADPRILAAAQGDQAFHYALGGSVLATGVMATVSSSFALNMALDAPTELIIPFGLMWGLIIFNLDRLLVAGYRRLGGIIKTLLSLVPRFVLAGLFGIVVAEPLLLKIFESEIDRQLIVINDRESEEALGKARSSQTVEQIAQIDRQIAAYQQVMGTLIPAEVIVVDEASADEAETEDDGDAAEAGSVPSSSGDAQLDRFAANRQMALDALQALDDERSDAQQRVIDAQEAVDEEERAGCEDSTSPGSVCQPGFGPRAQAKQVELEAEQAKLDQLEANQASRREILQGEIEQLTTQIDQRRTDTATDIQNEDQRRQDRIDELLEQRAKLQERANLELDEAENRTVGDGLLARIDSLGELRAASTPIFLAYWLLLGMLVAIDIVPISTKFVHSLGDDKPYEIVRKSIEADLQAKVDQAESDRSFELTTVKSVQEYRAHAVKANQERLMDRAAAAQLKMAERAIKEWERKHGPSGHQPVTEAEIRETTDRIRKTEPPKPPSTTDDPGQPSEPGRAAETNGDEGSAADGETGDTQAQDDQTIDLRNGREEGPQELHPNLQDVRGPNDGNTSPPGGGVTGTMDDGPG